MNASEWYLAAADSGEQRGPIPAETLRAELETGTIGRDDYLWAEGMGEWERAAVFCWFLEAGKLLASENAELAAVAAADDGDNGGNDANPVADDANAAASSALVLSYGKYFGRAISITAEDLVAFFGTNAEPYLALREKLVDTAGNTRLSWSWSPLFVPLIWLIYRRLYWWAGGLVAYFIVAMAAEMYLPQISSFIQTLDLAAFVFMAASAKSIVLCQADKAAQEATEMNLVGEDRRAFLAGKGGVSKGGAWIAGVIHALLAVLLVVLTIRELNG